MKECFKCGEEKDFSSFYKHKQMKDGYLGKCKDCAKKDSIENRNKNIQKYIQYDKDRANLPHRVEARKKYSLTEAGKLARKKANKNYVKKHPNKYKAHIIVNNAIRDKKLFREPCEICGEAKSHGHHDDYMKPLNIRWLCAKHHNEWHKENGEAKNP